MTSDGMKVRAAQQLAAAIKTMREACDRAEFDAATGDGNACQRVLHSLAWGFANASSGIESAMARVEDGHAIEAHNAKLDRDTVKVSVLG